METLKAKVLELKEKWNPPFWPLVLLAWFFAVPMVGGTLALGTYLVGASAGTVVWVVAGLVWYTYLIYRLIHGFLSNLDAQIAGKEERV